MEVFQLADLPALKEQIKSSRTTPRILGSRLGNLIISCGRAIDRQIEYKRFGGLRAFIANYLSELFDVVSDSSQTDYIYVAKFSVSQEQAPAVASSASSEPIEVAADGRAFWLSYSNPLVPTTFLLDDQSRLSSVSANLPTPGGYKNVSRPSSSDYAGWVKEYVELKLTDPTERAGVPPMSDEQTGYTTWVRYLKSLENKSHVKSWEVFRAAKVVKFLQSSLEAVGAAPEAVAKYLALLKRSQLEPRNEARRMPKSPELVASGGDIALDQRQLGIDQLRVLVKNAVDELSYERISEISLPVGVVVRALLSSRK
jgi:hypothetical protein